MDRQRVRQLPAFDLRKRMKYQINKTLIVSLDLWLKSPLSPGHSLTISHAA